MLLTGPGTRGPSGPARVPTAGALGAPRGGTRRLLLLVALLLGVAATLSPQAARAATDAYVSTDALNLRADPSTDGEVIATMAYGEYVAVIDGPTENGWYWVDYAGINGWAHGKYLSFDGSPAAVGAEVSGGGGTAWVGTDALNVRAEPSQEAGVLDVLPQGSELAVAGDPQAGFYPVLLGGGGIGWVWAEYVSWEPVGDASGAELWLDVDRSSSTVRMMEGDAPIATYAASLGFDDSASGFYATANGTYFVYEKIAGLTWSPFAQAYIKYWVGFDPSRLNGFHGYTMDADGRQLEWGDGPTAGCIATSPPEAKEIYRFATIGMRVEVHW